VARIGREPWPMTVDYRHAISDQTVWVAVLDGQVVGLIVLHKASDHLLIDNIAVDPAHQGGGVGTALMAFAEAQARDLRLFELRLYTNELMVENLAYYARRGYRESGRGIEAGFRRVYFVKELTDGTSRHD
jgi:GNAT superfamily N-acetyltransferase